MNPLPGDRLAQAPKAELHCHSDGVLDPAMVLRLEATETGAALASELMASYPVDAIAKWAAGYDPVLNRFLGLRPELHHLTILDHVDRWQRQGTRYAELFVSRVTMGIADEGAMIEWYRRLRSQLDAAVDPPRVNLLACVGRGPPARMARQAERISKLGRLGLITGVAYAGDELACSVRETRQFFDRFHAEGLGIEIHAGEVGGPASVVDALDFGHPKRLGHGFRAFEDEALVARLRETGIHLEFCPTSNLRLGHVASIDLLPVRKAIAAGIPFSINTDDPGVFGCSLTSELALVRDAFALTDEEMDRIYLNAIDAAFGSLEVAGGSPLHGS